MDREREMGDAIDEQTVELSLPTQLGYERVAIDRQGVTDMFTSDKAMEVVKRRKIKLISYSDLSGE